MYPEEEMKRKKGHSGRAYTLQGDSFLQPSQVFNKVVKAH